jgi:hypothetical protein
MVTRYAAWQPSDELKRALILGGICLLSVGCSDAGHRLGGATEQAQGSPAAPGSIPCQDGKPLEPIDLMEDGDGTIDFRVGRAGVWFAFNDLTGKQVPGPSAARYKMSELEPAREGSHYAAHTSGSGFTSWGAGIGFELRAQLIYDASAYAGISFWARRGADGTADVQLAIPDRETSPAGRVCNAEREEDESLCNDHFGYDLKLTEEFQYFSYKWEEMKAHNWSEKDLPAITPANIYGIRFQVEGGQDFDFWIDDVSFLCDVK